MPVLFRDTVTRQPQYNAPPASGTSLGRLAFAVTAAQLNAQINRATKSYTPYGVGVSSATDNVIQLRRDLSLQNANTVTFGALLYAPAAPTGAVYTRIFGTRGTTGSGSRRGWEIGLDGGSLVEMLLQVFDSAGNRTTTTGASGIAGADVVGKPICLIVEIVRSTNTVATGWLNIPGVAESQATATLASPFGDDTSNNFIELCGSLSGTSTNTDYNVLCAWGVQGAVTAKARKDFYDNPWHIFQPPARKLWLMGAAGGSAITATTSLSAAIQIARSATAGMNVAVQAGSSATAVVNAAVQQARTASVSLAAAVQEARSTTTSLNAAVQAATSTGASVNTAVQAPASASASLNTAVQQARSATPSVDAAVQAQGTAAASVNAAVQAGQGASSAVDVAIQQARAATASINTAVQASQTAAASIDAAVQAVGSATVGLNTYVQSDGAIGVSLNAAIQAQQQASAGLNLAVQLARSAASALDVVVALAQTASVSLNAYIQAPSEVTTALNAAIQDARSATISVNAAVQVQRTAQVSLSAALAVGQMLTAAVDVAVRAARSRSASLSAYIFDDSAPIPQRDFMRDISSYAAAPAPIRATLLGTSIRIHPR